MQNPCRAAPQEKIEISGNRGKKTFVPLRLPARFPFLLP